MIDMQTIHPIAIQLPPYWLHHPSVVRQASELVYNTDANEVLGVPHACPLSIRLASEADWWVLPIEPVVSVSGRNVIAKRQILKAGGSTERRGTVKELWAQDDYDVNISGLLMGAGDALPENDLRRLRRYCEAREALCVQSPLLMLFGIDRLAIEEYEFPATRGIENVMYNIRAVSDSYDADKLLLK